jgi:hypothetical protein
MFQSNSIRGSEKALGPLSKKFFLVLSTRPKKLSDELFDTRIAHCGRKFHGNGGFRAGPIAFMSAMDTFNLMLWRDFDLNLSPSVPPQIQGNRYDTLKT